MGPFGEDTPAFADFLRAIARDTGQTEAFVARNFLLDEGFPSARVDSYVGVGAARAHASYAFWQSAHEDYLAQRVFMPQDGLADLVSISPADAATCPETFRHTVAASPFAASDARLHLLRVEEIAFVARLSGVTEERIRDLALRVVTSANGADPVRHEFDMVLEAWEAQIDCRPVFAAFWEDIDQLGAFGDTPAEDAGDWADRLRDRLGLLHLDPAQRGGRPIGVLVFRYPVSDVPYVRERRSLRPLVPPTVLDSRHSPAFCPSPAGPDPTGHTIDLGLGSPPICREALHPAMRFRAAHVWRVGEIARGLGNNLKGLLCEARGLHLLCVREHCSRADYGADTDSDLV